jgi:hypothetical protein
MVLQETMNKKKWKNTNKISSYCCATNLYDDTLFYNTVYKLLHIQDILNIIGTS